MASQISSAQESTSQASTSQDSHTAKHYVTPYRKRKPKFSLEELEILAEEIAPHHRFLFRTPTSEAAAAKNAAKWAKILTRINGQGIYPRTLSDIKKRWYDLKRTTKSKNKRAQPDKTPTQLSKQEDKRMKAIEEMVSLSFSTNVSHGVRKPHTKSSQSHVESVSESSAQKDEQDKEDEHLKVFQMNEDSFTSEWCPEVSMKHESKEEGQPTSTHSHRTLAETDHLHPHLLKEKGKALDMQVVSADANSSPRLQQKQRGSSTSKNDISITTAQDAGPITAYQQLMLETCKDKNSIMHTTGKERNRRLATLEHRLHKHEQNQKTILRLVSELSRRTFQRYSEMTKLTKAVWQLEKLTSELKNPALLPNLEQPIENIDVSSPGTSAHSSPVSCVERTNVRGKLLFRSKTLPKTTY